MNDEDIMFEQRRQAMIDSEAWNSAHSIPWHQKVGTVIPFSRTVDRDPNPRIPLLVPENSYPRVSKKEAVFWLFVGAALIAWWTGVL
jgi:hypothetical protein